MQTIEGIIAKNEGATVQPFWRVLILVIILFASYVTVQGQPSIPEGRLNFMLPDLNGNIVHSTDSMFIGKVFMVTLWATWCPPCISEIPTLNDLQQRYRDSGLVIVAIAFETNEEDNNRQEQLRSFVTKYNINYLVLDGGTPNNIERSLPSVKNVSGLPVEILINRNGSVEVTRNGYGYSEVWAAKLGHEIKTLLKRSKN